MYTLLFGSTLTLFRFTGAFVADTPSVKEEREDPVPATVDLIILSASNSNSPKKYCKVGTSWDWLWDLRSGCQALGSSTAASVFLAYEGLSFNLGR